MAAVSAGAIQTGFLSESIAQPSPQLQQHHSEEQLQHNASSIGSSFVGQQQQQANYVQRINVENYLIAKQQTFNNNPNVAPGWRRQLSDGEIIYYSPSGTALRKLEQIKEYLLRHGTCKCGLPCPLRPDFFFEFNPQVPNSPLQIPPEHVSNSTQCCLHTARFIEQHSHLTNEIGQPTDFSHCLSSSNQKSSTDAVLKTNQDGSPSEDTAYSESGDSSENQVESVTVSRTPPWQKNSILNQQQQQQQQQPTQQNMVMSQNVDSINVPQSQDNRVPPLPQQHLVQLQPPWQNETQKRRTISKKRLNFKEDPTGYLNHQTAILHSSILNVHSPELQDTEMVSTVPLHSYRQSPNLMNRSSPQLSTDALNTAGDLNFPNDIGVGDDHDQHQKPQQMSVMQQQQQQQQQQQNQNVYISKDQMIVVSDGQPIRVLQSSTPIIYSNASGEIAMDTLNVSPQISQPTSIKMNELIGGKRVQQNLQHIVQIREKSDCQQVVKMHTVSAAVKEAVTQKAAQYVVAQIEHEASGVNKDQQIDVTTHPPNGLIQVQHNCDINQVKNQTQTILMKSKLNDHKYILPQQQQQRSNILTKIVTMPQESSPVSSSTTNKSTILNNQSTTPNDTRGPSQVETISTSHESPPSSSPDTSASPESLSSSAMNDSHMNVTNKSQTSVFIAGQTSGKNTITSVLAGKAMTSTTTTNQFAILNQKDQRSNSLSGGNLVQIHENRILKSASAQHSLQQATNRQMNNITVNINAAAAMAPINIKTSNNQNQQTIVQGNPSPIPAQTSLANIQIQQQQQQQPTNQIIMTSSGCQILVMPTQNTKTSNQMIIGHHHQPTNASVVLNQQNAHHMIGSEIIQGLNDSTMGGHTATPNIIQNAGNSVVIQSPNLIQPPNNVITANNANTNYIVSSPNAIQPMIINNSNLLTHNGNVLHHHHHHHHQSNQNVLQGNANSMLTTANATKVISNAGNLLSPSNILTNHHQSSVLTTNNQFISSNNSGSLLSPNNNSIVLNQLSNASYVIQPQSFATVDGQVVNVINSDNGQNQFLQQTQTQRIILSPDSKRRVKKRKNSSVSPQNLSAQQSPTPLQTPPPQPQQQTTVLQIAAPQYHQSHQSFQTTSIEQQILLQNGQTILQPLNLIGQQLLVPAGLMMTSDTVLQIQNVAPCSLITPQGVVQNKSFLSPNSANQQFIMSGNGQISPIGQMYSTLVVPQSLHTPQSNGPTFVQQSTTIVQQQTTMMNNSSGGGSGNGSSGSGNAVNETDISINVPQSVSTQTNSHTVHTVTSSPPDTTTHSPRSPERPESQRSIASDINMVQFVSSSEPDSVVSPATESAQSPSGDYDRITNISYTMGSMYKPNEAKLRRIQAVTQFTDNAYKMKPDSHEASSPLSSASISTASNCSTASTSPQLNLGTCSSSMFSVGNLVWGAVRGHTAWPGKIVPAPNADKSQNDATCWVRWFGGKPSIELVQISSLKSLSEGLEAHHKAQKDNRKSRKLNSQLEKAIQEAMAELDVPLQQTTTTTTAAAAIVTTISTTSVTSADVLRSKSINVPSTSLPMKTTRTRVTRASTAKERRIAPAPPPKIFHV